MLISLGLEALTMGDHKILIEHPGPVYVINEEFTCKLKKFKVKGQIKKPKEVQEQRQRDQAKVDEDRKHYLDAAIVSIMKANKLLSHKELIQKLMERVKFPLEVRELR